MGKIINVLDSLELFIIRLKRKILPGIVFTSKDREYRKYEIGEFTYGTPKVLKYNQNSNLKIGKFCSIAEGVKIFLGGEHQVKNISTYPFKTIFKKDCNDDFSKGDVIIGNDVWIGYEATILSGVTIGDGAVIGAMAVVAKSVEPYAIVIGNPGKEIKKRFDEKTTKKLLSMKWWEWDIKKIIKSQEYLSSNK